ncbi:hypothetical protein KFE25_011189 [Diacronema lutheri]|uniref:Protein kinase domain-containing protein n=1 Tax=Diacronema lutheri TaxID=2081491 RepID=A0A8J6C635_DIALT|nr:hypothetical protein KFE25_011189 [Diacronema lutheri]
MEPEPLFCEAFSDVADMFEVGRKLGSGNFAKVIQATCKRQIAELRPGSQVAIKIVKKPSNMSPAAAEMLRSEIAILRSVRHPNIVRLYEVLETPGKLYLVMQLCTGGELFDRIVNMGRYSEEDARYFAFKLLNAVLYLHDQHICHRDLKPENILLASADEDAELCITDFGLGKVIVSATEGVSWREVALRTRCGTPGYAAPEVISASYAPGLERRYGLECDMWAVGVVVYILLSACPPFSARDDEAMQAAICDSNGPPFPPKYWATISPSAIDLIRSLLVVDPAKRLTAFEALQHPWVVSIQANANDLLGDEADASASGAPAHAAAPPSARPGGDGVAPPFRDRFGEFNLQRRTTARGLLRVQQLMAVEMGLPEGEDVRQLWRCSYEKRLGQLVLSTEHVGFVAYDSTSLWLRPLSELVHLNTARYVASNAATDNSLILSFRDGHTAQLDGFWARDDCLQAFGAEEATRHVTTRHEPPPPPPPRMAGRDAHGTSAGGGADGGAVFVGGGGQSVAS